MHNKIAVTATVLALFVMAAVALAQNADQNTGGPTKNTLKLTLTEPLEGATITGTVVRVTVGYNPYAFGAGQGTHFGEANFPQPRFDVYLDNTLKTTLKGTESNVATIENVPPGSHKIVVVALNVSGEIIDRKEVNVTTAELRMAKEVPREPAPIPAYEPAPPPAPVEATTLPTTGSHAPKLALAGFALIACGLLLARKAR
jgi:LPXTG-motif cell wall-anchored protein